MLIILEIIMFLLLLNIKHLLFNETLGIHYILDKQLGISKEITGIMLVIALVLIIVILHKKLPNKEMIKTDKISGSILLVGVVGMLGVEVMYTMNYINEKLSFICIIVIAIITGILMFYEERKNKMS